MVTVARKVGISPGTTAMVLGRPENRSQDPGTFVRNYDGQVVFAGAPGPSDFDKAKMWNYVPVHRGWIEGRPATGLGGRGWRLAQDASDLPPPTEEDLRKLEARVAQEQIKSHHSQRVWATVTGLIGLGSLVVTVIALRSGLRRT